MLDWDAPDIKSWKEEVRMLQQDIFFHFGDKEWDAFDKSDTVVLHRKVGYGLYSFPEYLPEGNNSTGYREEQIQNIKLVADFIVKCARSDKVINFACIFIFVKIYDKRCFTPVFKVKGTQNQTLFIDSDCQVYENWSNYLDSNHLPKCLYCYPRDGVYQGDKNQVLIDFGSSPACNLKNDSTVTAVNFAPTSLMMASLFTLPIATQNLGQMQTTSLSTEAYHVSESNMNLGDDQSKDPDDSEANTDWFGLLLGSVLSIAQNCLGTSIAQSAADGNVSSKAMRIAHDVVTVGSLTVNGWMILKSLISLFDKGCLTSLDTFRFSSALLFFTNSLLQADTAEEIIMNIQEQVLNQHCEDLTAEQIEKLFGLLEVHGKTELHKNANKIKAINHIPNKQAFFEILVNLEKSLEGHQVQFSFQELGLINIDNELHIAPNKLLQISVEDRQMILDALPKVSDYKEKDAYWHKIEKKLQYNRIKLEFQRRIAIEELKLAFKTDNLDAVKIGNKYIFKNMAPPVLDRLASVVKAFGNYNPKMFEITNEFAKQRCCETVFDYCNYLELVKKYLEKQEEDKEKDYQKTLKDVKSKRRITDDQFAIEYGIKGKRKKHFLNQVYSEFYSNWEKSFSGLEQLYSELESSVLPLNAKIKPKFALNTSAIYHYYKHFEFDSRKLTQEEYFTIASELVNEPLNERSTQLNQQGNKMHITFTDPVIGGKAVVVEELEDGARYLVTFYYDDKVLAESNC